MLIKKYLDPLSDIQIYVLLHNVFYDPPKETKFNDFKRKKFRKLWIEIIIDTYAAKVRNKGILKKKKISRKIYLLNRKIKTI